MNYLIVSDYSNGDVIFYDLDNHHKFIIENDVMSIKALIMVLEQIQMVKIQIIPPLDGDLNGAMYENLITHCRFFLDPESEIIADIIQIIK